MGITLGSFSIRLQTVWRGILARRIDPRLIVAIFCIGLLVFFWSTLLTDLETERERVIEATKLQNANLAAAFDEHVTRTLEGGDIILREVKRQFEMHGKSGIAEHMSGFGANTSPYRVVSMADEHGDQVAASYSVNQPKNWRNSENFQYHEAHGTDEPYISRPRPSAGKDKWTIFLSRRINHSNGRFAGDVVVGIDVGYFSNFYKSFDLGPGGVISLIGSDGIVRASHSARGTTAGDDRSASNLFMHKLPESKSGSYTGNGVTDGIVRIMSYRTLKDFPLVVVIGISQEHALKDFFRQRSNRIGWAAIFSLVAALFAALLIAQLSRLASADRRLRASEQKYRVLIETTDTGYLILDNEGRVVDANEHYVRLSGHTCLDQILGRCVTEWTAEHDVERNALEVAACVKHGRVINLEIDYRDQDGCTTPVEINATVVNEDGKIRILSLCRDISARRRSDEIHERLAAIVENSSDAIISRRLDGVITSWNAAAERMFGYDAAEALGRKLREMIPPDEQGGVDEDRRLIATGYSIVAVDAIRITKDGRQVHVSRTASPIRDRHGNIVGVSAILRDITAHKQAEIERTRLAAIVENSLDAIVSMDLDRTIVTWNAAAEHLFGFAAQEAIGSHVSIILPPERAAEGERLNMLARQGNWLAPFETVRIAKDGRRIDVSVGRSPIKDLSGRVIGVSVVFRDVSERIRAETQLRLAASVFASTAEGILITDKNNDIVSVNPAFTEITGYSADEAIGRNPRFLQSGRQSPEFYSQMWRAVNETGRWTGEIWERRKNGELYCELLSINSVRDDSGKIVQYCGIFADVTARKLAEERIEQLNADLERRVQERTADLTQANRSLEFANKELEAFSYSVSHDLRAPLRAVIGYSSFALEEKSDSMSAKTFGFLTKIKNSGEHMARLVDDLLSLSRLSRQEMRLRQIDLSVIAQEVVSALAQAEPARHAEIVIRPNMICSADRGLMFIVMQNLIENAWKYSSRVAAPKIEIGAEQRDAETIYYVRDNGAGFDMRYAAKLFGVFQRLHSAAEFDGTGIGLSIVQRIVNRHGGKIWAEARPGAGATFYFTLGKPEAEHVAHVSGRTGT